MRRSERHNDQELENDQEWRFPRELAGLAMTRSWGGLSTPPCVHPASVGARMDANPRRQRNRSPPAPCRWDHD